MSAEIQALSIYNQVKNATTLEVVEPGCVTTPLTHTFFRDKVRTTTSSVVRFCDGAEV